MELIFFLIFGLDGLLILKLSNSGFFQNQLRLFLRTRDAFLAMARPVGNLVVFRAVDSRETLATSFKRKDFANLAFETLLLFGSFL